MENWKLWGYSWGYERTKLLLRGTELRLYAGEIEHSVILSIKKKGEKNIGTTKNSFERHKKIFKKPTGLSVLTILVS